MTRTARTESVPFQIRVEQRVLDDLSARLRRTRWTAARRDDGWDAGTSASYLRDLVAYWLSTYDFRAHEARLNALPQYRAEVGGEMVHFLHLRGKGPRPMPLLLLHGWPDSFYRYHRVAPALADPASVLRDPADAFDVVVPSLPGFGFTGPLKHPVTEQPTRHSAHLMGRLMTEVLGYDRFVVAGGDGGGAFAQILAIDHPESVLGIHLTDLGWHAHLVDPATASREERKYLEGVKERGMKDGAYALVQMTRPRSLAAALLDSPAGLASWIVDRFHAWSDLEVEDGIDQDDLLTNVMIYWATGTIGSSMYSYYADARSPSLRPTDRVERPVGLALFPKDIGGVPPRSFAERTLNVQRWREMPRGGHFAALEVPDLYAHELTEFCRPLRGVRPEPGRRSTHVAPIL